MSSHAWRPVMVIVAVVIAGLVVRQMVIPKDFAAKNGDYKYQWHRLSNEDEWKKLEVKHMGRDFCKQCHPDKIEIVADSGHKNVSCENCHVQFNLENKGHKTIDLKADYKYQLDIGIDRSRELCKRCHSKLKYRPDTYTLFSKGPIPFKMIDPEKHNPGVECVMCHDVHKTGFK